MRLFLAIDPGDESRHRIATLLEDLRGITTKVRWVQEGKLHVTLAFLGDVAERQVPALVEGGSELTQHHPAFRVTVEGGGAFPDWRRVRVVWIGLHDRGDLQRLGDAVTTFVAGLGFPSDHPFRAHLTIGRATDRLSGRERDRLRDTLSRARAHHFDVTRVVLMQSVLGRAGSVYSELASFALGGP